MAMLSLFIDLSKTLGWFRILRRPVAFVATGRGDIPISSGKPSEPEGMGPFGWDRICEGKWRARRCSSGTDSCRNGKKITAAPRVNGAVGETSGLSALLARVATSSLCIDQASRSPIDSDAPIYFPNVPNTGTMHSLLRLWLRKHQPQSQEKGRRRAVHVAPPT